MLREKQKITTVVYYVNAILLRCSHTNKELHTCVPVRTYFFTVQTLLTSPIFKKFNGYLRNSDLRTYVRTNVDI